MLLIKTTATATTTTTPTSYADDNAIKKYDYKILQCFCNTNSVNAINLSIKFIVKLNDSRVLGGGGCRQAFFADVPREKSCSVETIRPIILSCK